ncbi:hypothetical protein TNCV_2904221 [Trichonephila clavipes]|nr:hypothetical protein TNCV_2904221 [Trichonephila clavipes]
MISGGCESAKKDARGPIFRNEPPSRIEFSNSSGTELRCSADGVPTQEYLGKTRDGIVTKDVPGLETCDLMEHLCSLPFRSQIICRMSTTPSTSVWLPITLAQSSAEGSCERR